MGKVTKLVRDGSGFECKPELLVLLQEWIVVGFVNLWKKPLLSPCFVDSGSGHKTTFGIEGYLDHEEDWTS